jgi:hypothetical protein
MNPLGLSRPVMGLLYAFYYVLVYVPHNKPVAFSIILNTTLYFMEDCGSLGLISFLMGK